MVKVAISLYKYSKLSCFTKFKLHGLFIYILKPIQQIIDATALICAENIDVFIHLSTYPPSKHP